MYKNIIVLKDNGNNPDDYGKVDKLDMRVGRFSLIVTSPFLNPELFLSGRALSRKCLGVHGQYQLPFYKEESELWKFCVQNCIPFYNTPLDRTVLYSYVEHDGAIFYKVKGKLLLVHIRKDIKTLKLTDKSIIGISANTVNLDNVEYLEIPGKIYGQVNLNYMFNDLHTIGNTLVYVKESMAIPIKTTAFL